MKQNAETMNNNRDVFYKEMCFHKESKAILKNNEMKEKIKRMSLSGILFC